MKFYAKYGGPYIVFEEEHEPEDEWDIEMYDIPKGKLEECAKNFKKNIEGVIGLEARYWTKVDEQGNTIWKGIAFWTPVCLERPPEEETKIRMFAPSIDEHVIISPID